MGSKSSCSSCPREKEVGGRAPLFLQEIVQPRVTLKKLSLKKKKRREGKKKKCGGIRLCCSRATEGQPGEVAALGKRLQQP